MPGMPGTPRSPLSPLGPGSPGGPWSPGLPGSPVGPLCPVSPLIPCCEERNIKEGESMLIKARGQLKWMKVKKVQTNTEERQMKECKEKKSGIFMEQPHLSFGAGFTRQTLSQQRHNLSFSHSSLPCIISASETTH